MQIRACLANPVFVQHLIVTRVQAPVLYCYMVGQIISGFFKPPVCFRCTFWSVLVYTIFHLLLLWTSFILFWREMMKTPSLQLTVHTHSHGAMATEEQESHLWNEVGNIAELFAKHKSDVWQKPGLFCWHCFSNISLLPSLIFLSFHLFTQNPPFKSSLLPSSLTCVHLLFLFPFSLSCS